MTLNQDPKQNKLSIPMTGIEVMNDLSLDAKQMFHLVRERLLLPYDPKDFFRLNLEMNSNYDSPEITLSRWTYLESDVEEFKLKYKDFWEKLRQYNDDALAESRKQGSPESEDLISTGEKHCERSKKRRSRSSDDREEAIMFAKKYIDQHQTNKKKPYTCHNAAADIALKLDKKWSSRTIKGWIKPYFPDEAKAPGRPKKKI